MWKLFLDDYRWPEHINMARNEFIIARSYNEAVALVKEHGAPEFISFDHDLADAHYGGNFSSEKTGMDFAKWLVETDIDNQGNFLPDNFTYNVHSMNPDGARNIRGLMENWLHEKKKRKHY